MSLALQEISLTHPGGNQALSKVSLSLERGERVAVIGPSGAGKTSLLRILATSLRPSQGEVRILGENPWRLSRAALRSLRSRIGMVHQAPPLPGRQRAVTTVLAGRLGRWPLWKSLASLLYPADIPGARALLARLEIGDRLFERCERLSGGQLQRVGIARVLYQQPELMLADEPVSAMDPALADRTVGELNREAVSRGITLVASLHAVDLALRWFPRIVGIKTGVVQFDLPPVRVSNALLENLYASENAAVPTQDNRPLAFEQGIRRKPLCF
ncbi:MAG TPA: ATP-binding cassette domain-containing protein [Burkholderiales bacterium]|nr:ATP-binding cassette domain-containing protein [Burkholderiales bacterium]